MTKEKEQMIKQAFNKAFDKNFGEDKEIKYNKDEKWEWVPYEQLAETPQQTITRLEQENKELKGKKDKYYQQTLDDEILMNELSLEVDLRKKESDFYLEKLSNYRSALEEIREVLKFYADTWIDEKIYPNLHYDNTKAKEGLSRINEVLNDN